MFQTFIYIIHYNWLKLIKETAELVYGPTAKCSNFQYPPWYLFKKRILLKNLKSIFCIDFKFCTIYFDSP